MGKKPMSGNHLTPSISESSDVETKKRPPPPTNDSLLRVLRPKVYITDSSSFKKLVQELTGNGSLNPSYPLQSPSSSFSLSSSPPTLSSIVMAEDRGRIEDTMSSEDDSAFGHQMLSATSPNNNPMLLPCDLDYVSFPVAASYKGVDFSYDDVESWLWETEPATSVSVWYEHEPIDVSIYDSKIF